MSKDTYTDCSYNLDSEDIQLDKTSGEESEPMCEWPNEKYMEIVHREIDPVSAQKFVQQVENELIISILGTLSKKSVIPRGVYENAVNSLNKQ